MHFFSFLSLVLVAPALASPLSPLAASADSQIAPRQNSTTDPCTAGCNTAQSQINACGANSPACYCTAAIAQEMENCANCKLAADPSQAINLQAMLTQYANGCQANNHTVGSLTLTGNGATAAIAAATESMASAASTRSVAAASRSAAAAGATAGSTKNGSSASVGSVRTGSALLAAGISVALVFL